MGQHYPKQVNNLQVTLFVGLLRSGSKSTEDKKNCEWPHNITLSLLQIYSTT